MLTVNDAFRKFKSRLELNDREQKDASNRQTEVRSYLDTKFEIERSFLTGSYARWTKTKPLRDVDIFCVLDPESNNYRSQAPSVVLDDFTNALVEKYGANRTTRQNRSVNVDFGVRADSDDNTDYQLISVDVVPAVEKGDDFEIPDLDAGDWIATNPEVHADKAISAHQSYSNEWKGLVRMIKYWNNNSKHGDRPIRPSFLVEVMALECLHGGWGGSFDREIQSFFATLADRVVEEWPDPAGLGPSVSNAMTVANRERARGLLRSAERQASLAINCARDGRNGDALRSWREIFGPKFPLS